MKAQPHASGLPLHVEIALISAATTSGYSSICDTTKCKVVEVVTGEVPRVAFLLRCAGRFALATIDPMTHRYAEIFVGAASLKVWISGYSNLRMILESARLVEDEHPGLYEGLRYMIDACEEAMGPAAKADGSTDPEVEF